MTFEEFAAAQLPAVLRFAAVLAGDRAAAEDLAQEVLIRGRSVPLGSVIRIPAAGGHPAVLYTEPPPRGSSGHSVNSACSDPMWISATGRKVLLTCVQRRPATAQRKAVTRVHIVLLANGRVRELPWLAGIPADITAFPGITASSGVPALP
jgi:hypothetical protein